MKQVQRRALLSAIGLASSVLFVPNVWAQSYPNQPVKLVVPYPPGGATDVIGRVLAQKLGDKLGQQFVVENRAGVGGSLGAGQVAKSPADGYTLLMGAFTSHAINAALQPKTVPFNIQTSFSPIAIVGTVPLVFVVNGNLPAKNLQDLIALAKAKPGNLAFASAGNGSPQHLATELFKRTSGVDVMHVPYKGSGPAMTDLVGGQVQAMIETVPAALPHIKSGRLRALATTTAEPVSTLPDVPTSAAAGLANFTVSSMFGIAAPADTPAPIVTKLSNTLKSILADNEVKELLLQQGAIATFTTPAVAQQRINAEFTRWERVIREGNIKPD